MEVLRSTFLEKLPIVKRAIEDADYIAIDTELTGLNRPINGYRATDDLAARYDKVSQSAREFMIIQFGLACFKWNAAKRAYVAQPFNFYIFPSGEPREAGERYFTCSSSSLKFLMECNFDFNKLIQEGVSYLTQEEITTYLERINMARNKEDIAVDDKNKEFFETTRAAIDEWLQAGTSKTLDIDTVNSYLKRLVYQIISEPKYNGYLAAKSLDRRQMQIRKLTEENRKSREELVQDAPLDINFCTVIDYIKKAKCPVIGHNCFLDVCQIISQFCQRLPDDINDWKTLVTKTFKSVIDTKHLSNHPKIKEFLPSTALGPLYENMSRDPFKSHGPNIVLDADFKRYSLDANSDSVAHEAGFDALMTGVVYLRMAYYILRNEIKERTAKQASVPALDAASVVQPALKPFSIRESIQIKTMENDTDISVTNSITATNVITEHEPAATASESEESESESESESEDGEVSEDDIMDNEDDNPSRLLNLSTTIRDFYDKLHLMRCELYYVDLKGDSEGLKVRKDQFYLRNIPMGLTAYGLQLLYSELMPCSILWKTDSTAWLTVKHENRIELAKPGVLGMDAVKAYLEDDTKKSLASNNGITKQAAQIEMQSSQAYHDMHRMGDHGGQTANGKSEIAPVSQSFTPEVSSPVATGGAHYAEFDFDIPASLQPSHHMEPEIKIPAKRRYVDLDTPESSDTAKKQHTVRDKRE